MMNFNEIDFEMIKNVENLYFYDDESTFIENGLIVQNNVLIGFTNFVTNLEVPYHGQTPNEDLYLSSKIVELDVGCLAHQMKYNNIYVPKSVKKINDLSFRGTKIKKVVIENPNVELGIDLFQECDELELVIIGDKIMYKK